MKKVDKLPTSAKVVRNNTRYKTPNPNKKTPLMEMVILNLEQELDRLEENVKVFHVKNESIMGTMGVESETVEVENNEESVKSKFEELIERFSKLNDSLVTEVDVLNQLI